MDMLAAVTLENWTVLVLILMSCGSLVLALWCFMFMASEKKMVEQVQNMGQNFQGIENRLGEIQQHVSKKIDDLEVRTHTVVSETRDSMQKDIQQAGDKAERGLQAIGDIRTSLSASERSFSLFKDDVNGSVAVIGDQVTSLRQGITKLEIDLKKSIKDQVNSSMQQLDATILAVLETIQHEMLRGVDRLRDIQDVVVARNEEEDEAEEDKKIIETQGEELPALELDEIGDLEEEDAGNIIAAEPLFACLASRTEPPVEEEEEEADLMEPQFAFVPEEITVSADMNLPADEISEATLEEAEVVETVAEPEPVQAEIETEEEEVEAPPLVLPKAEAEESYEPVDIIERLGLFDDDEEDQDELL